jgi:radical SAM superfamily enzyme YgiQ (UPF0313 family)
VLCSHHAVADLVLIHPPVSLPSEPPLGLATLAASLRRQGAEVALVDANVEALQQLIDSVPPQAAADTADRRALRQRQRALAQLRSSEAFRSRDRHHAAVATVRRTLGLVGRAGRPDLADYHDAQLSPLSRQDLLASAERHGASPFADYYQELARRVAGLAPRAVGISINYLHQALPAMALAGALRAHLGGVPIVAGGGLISCWRDRLDRGGLAPAIDHLVFGDGTADLLALLGQPASPDGPVLPDYSDMPWPLYLAPTRIASLSTSRGCYWSRCRYCPEAAQGERFATSYRDHLVQSLSRVWHEAGAGLLHLSDSAIPPASLRRLTALREPGLRWYGFARFHPSLADEDLCRGLREAGCVLLQLGLESGSDRVLRRLNKGIDLDVASRALRTLARAGIASYLYVMFGTPGEGRADAEQTLRFVVDHAASIGFLNVSLLNLPRTIAPEADLVTRPLLGDGDLSLYVGFSHAGGWQRQEARHFMERELARHPAVAALLRRTPHVFGPNHAPFFCAETAPTHGVDERW